MRKRRRTGQIELNFDGLTDSVTNLVGSLVLLVVLVVAATRPMEEGVQQLPSPDNVAGETTAIDPLLEEMRRLKEQIASLDGSMQQMEARIPGIDAEIKTLKSSVEFPK